MLSEILCLAGHWVENIRVLEAHYAISLKEDPAPRLRSTLKPKAKNVISYTSDFTVSWNELIMRFQYSNILNPMACQAQNLA
ncbi:hypothetical protein AWG70_15870 [Escherichia coli]|nr:hypothetical protein AWF58_22285 [Escherichia coli]KZH16903.1 hypothetical protein AWG33_12655 [Escherichia coli]KZI63642.1 hypothetical protein AWG70_15870 [Escherichia coli]